MEEVIFAREKRCYSRKKEDYFTEEEVLSHSIFSNVVMSFEILHSMKRKSRGKTGNVALKIDISKAYDRISWNFFARCYALNGFCKGLV